MDAVTRLVLPAMTRQQPVTEWIVDDTRIPTKDRHWAGVAQQHCGDWSTLDNCQMALPLSARTRATRLPVAWRLYLPKDWTEDRAPRRKAGMPEEVEFQSWPENELGQIREALDRGLPCGGSCPMPAVVRTRGSGNSRRS